MEKGKARKCPVCDAEFDESARVCPNCNVEVGVFEGIAGEGGDLAKTGEREIKKSAEILELVTSAKEDEELIERVKQIGEEVEASESREGARFQCPACGAIVDASAATCPKCNATFAEETGGAEVAESQFQCPVCESVIDHKADSCPKCGVQFTADEEEAKPEKEETERAKDGRKRR